ncbi:nuclease-related domain-containing protein [Marinicellulosiphila megalodicopiae]|uniref:nuclease-related domain-containing protein n=1 Tax=Marinicellulosiphila megalodicopiae TaxID=2724896 RepID=UPI003BAE88D8
MICKDKDPIDAQSARIKAGIAHEQSVAFYLRREFKNQSDILVFNDLTLSFDDEKCQIDHLIVYRYGFILIESKSITGDVRVNELGEWSRSFNRQFSGMASPIKQVELQQKLLKELLAANASSILGRLIFNKFQMGFGGRCWDQLCAISSNAIINRDQASESVKNKMVKAEFIVDRCKEIMKLPTSILDSASKFLDSRPGFKAAEIENIRKFLLEADKSCRSKNKNQKSKNKGNKKVEIKEEQPLIEVAKEKISTPIITKPRITKPRITTPRITTPSIDDVEKSVHLIQCKKCNEAQYLTGKWGKYGYYVFCSKCECNTSMKINCPLCESKNVKNRKEKSNYYVVCLECEKENLVFEEQIKA